MAVKASIEFPASAGYLGHTMALPPSPSDPPTPLFEGLSGGPSARTPEEVARHQRRRLEGAMLEAVGRYGYNGMTLSELVKLAGVSKTTFYEHFEGKADLFLATFDEIERQVGRRIAQAFAAQGDFDTSVREALLALMQVVAEEPAAAWLTAVESLALGADGTAHRERASEEFEALFRQGFADSPGERPVPEITTRAIVGGVRGVVYRHLRARSQDELPEHVDELVDWALCYQRPRSDAVERAMGAAEEEPAPAAEPGESALPGWEEPPDSKRSRRSLSQRERIVRATARVVIERGWPALSIPSISGAAGVSNQTFYENFSSKFDALMAAFEALFGEAREATLAAYDPDRGAAEAIGASIRAMLEHIAGHEVFARLAFFELPTAGAAALDHADELLDRLIASLGSEPLPAELGDQLPSGTVLTAVAGGIWAVIQREIAHGHQLELSRRAPEITEIALAPFCSEPR